MLEPAPGVARLLDARFQTVGKKSEGVQQATFADSVFPDHRGDWSQRLDVLDIQQVAERDAFQHPVVVDEDAFDSCHGSIPLVHPVIALRW